MLLSNEQKNADMRGAYGDTLVELGASNQNIVCVGADTTDSLKIKKFGDYYPDRFFNVGIAEANLVSVADWPCNCRQNCVRKYICRISPRTMP